MTKQQFFVPIVQMWKNYNNLIFQELFTSNEVFDVVLDTNASKFEHMQQWIKDPHFEHIKKKLQLEFWFS